MPTPGENFEGHCWVETDDYIIDFSDFWFCKIKKEDYHPTDFFTRKDKLLTLDEIAFDKKVGAYYSSIPEFIKTIEHCHEVQDKKYLEILSEPVISVFKSLFINFALYLYYHLSEDYLSAETV